MKKSFLLPALLPFLFAFTGKQVPDKAIPATSFYYSRYLYASNFGFHIPGNAVINGITLDIQRQPEGSSTAQDSIVRLVKENNPSGSNRANHAPWPLNPAFATYGSPGDLWGCAWTAHDINAASFGVYFSASNVDGDVSVNPNPNTIRITIDYTLPDGSHHFISAFPASLHVRQAESLLPTALS
jgi:hypothetical protein